MEAIRPQYYKNELQPVCIDKPTLDKVLDDLRAAINHGLGCIISDCPLPDPTDPSAFHHIFYGSLGVAAAFLRLQHQASYLTTIHDSIFPVLRAQANDRVNPHVLEFDKRGPLISAALGAVLLRITTSTPAEGRHIEKADIEILSQAVELALNQGNNTQYQGHTLGVDEVLNGRAGLLWALIKLQQQKDNEGTKHALDSILQATPKLTDTIINGGKLGAQEYINVHGKEGAMPLMWHWLDGYYAPGAIHGSTGIIAILLGADISNNYTLLPPDYIPDIASTITSICELSIAHNGHLPMSVPERPAVASRTSPLLQVCHGSPGLLLLLDSAFRHKEIANFKQEEWVTALFLATERVWEEGLLSKGGGLCHGIAGNAWPLLLLHDSTKKSAKGSWLEPGSSDYYLSRALALLLEARSTQPFTKVEEGKEGKYRMPDDPYSLFGGLAGTVCAWSEACLLIEERLREMETGEIGDGTPEKVLGVPGLGIFGTSGLI